MDKMVIAGVREGLDGEYEFDATAFTNFELHAIKRLTDLTAGGLGDAFEKLDNDVLVAMGMVALMREGKIAGRTPWASSEVAALWDSPVGSIYLSSDEAAEDDADPPALAPDEPGSLDDEEPKSNGSGETSSGDSVLPEAFLSRTGDPT